jgi:hypothetical protein
MPRALVQKLHFLLVSLLIQHKATLRAPTQFTIKALALQQVIMARCQLALTRQMDLGYMTYMVMSLSGPWMVIIVVILLLLA